MNSNVIKTMPKIKLSKDAKNASIDKISDEEIGQAFKDFSEDWVVRQALEEGAKWYREQLKLRQ